MVAGPSGMTEELPVKEGMYVEKGQTVFQVFNMDRSWVLLKVYPGDAGLVKKGTLCGWCRRQRRKGLLMGRWTRFCRCMARRRRR
ncbi:efflux RND transporter periplasmic adaptor subunit [Puia sp. P3]|uniref:efflux RND transporter periplasmic adaptor subunit n=1 Tax=Puia sp. P3 TaxID=3423952 RepID=UPI003D66B136